MPDQRAFKGGVDFHRLGGDRQAAKDKANFTEGNKDVSDQIDGSHKTSILSVEMYLR